MKICYWGTAAAEGVPGIFCNCKVCEEARLKKGKYVRTRSQLMIDDVLMVDFNADIYMHSLKYDYNLANLKDVLVTHIHADHYYPMDITMRRTGYAHDMKYPTLYFHGSEDIVDQYKYALKNDGCLNDGRVKFDILEPYKSYDISGYSVVSLPAMHGTPHPRFYIIQKDGKTALILNDSGVPKEEVFEWLKNSRLCFDLVSYDCTMGNLDTIKAWGKDASHMGIPNILEVRKRFSEYGNINADTKEVITHFSHNGEKVGYGEMSEVAKEYGFILAYDGLTVEI